MWCGWKYNLYYKAAGLALTTAALAAVAVLSRANATQCGFQPLEALAAMDICKHKEPAP